MIQELCDDGICKNYKVEPGADSDLPPDRRMLGRSAWTFFHATAAYLPAVLGPDGETAFVNLWRSVNHSYACSLCRGHFHYIFNDKIVQAELAAVKTRQDAQLWTWKIHNAVTANNFPTWPAFPSGLGLTLAPFRIPDTNQQFLISKMNATMRSKIVKKIEKRWKIHGGLDASKTTNDACPASSEKVLQMDLFIMGLCPFCRVALKNIRPMLKCNIKCTTDDDTIGNTGMLDFRLHFVGAIDKKTKELMSLHGPNEVQTDKLYLCAIKYYPKNYQYLDLIECMEKSQKDIPSNAQACAKNVSMDWSQLTHCIHTQGTELLRKSFEFSIGDKVNETPEMVVSHGGFRQKVDDPSNETQVAEALCRMLKHPEPGGAKKISKEHVKVKSTAKALPTSKMSSFVGGVVLQQLAPTKPGEVEAESEQSEEAEDDEKETGPIDEDDQSEDDSSEVHVTEGKHVPQHEVKAATKAVSRMVSKMAKLGRKPRESPVEHDEREPASTKTLHRKKPSRPKSHDDDASGGLAMAGMPHQRGHGYGSTGEKNGKNGMPVISPVIVGIGLAISFLMVIGAGVFVVLYRNQRESDKSERRRLMPPRL
jgi:hypothetical protein